MIRNQNGYWMSPQFAALFAPDGGAGDGGDAGADAGADLGTDVSGNGAESTDKGTDTEQKENRSADDLNAEIARLKAEMAKQKDAKDKAMKEAGDLRKELRSKQTAEEIAATEKKEAEEKAAKELEDLRKEVAKGKTVKSVMGKLGIGEDAAGSLADCLYGAADPENALLLIQKEWQAKEKALKLEYGKITGPGAGADSNSPEAAAVKRATEIGKARNAANEQAQKAMNAYIR